MKLGFEPQEFWCGTQSTYDYVIECSLKAEVIAADRPDTGLPPMWGKAGNTAVVDIQGPLVQGDAGFMRLFGITGYDNIREAVAQAIADEEVHSILLNVDSGGGQVSGVTDTAKFLAEAGKIKPISTYTGGTMASAALWTGATSQHITASDTATVGSIGVLVVHTERSKMLAEMGITPTVVRAGEFKAITNNIEPLSDAGKAQLQATVNHMYQPFLQHMAEWRNTSAENAQATFAEGRVFTGSQALDAGLVDKIGTYEDALAKAAQLGLSAKSAKSVRTNVAKASVLADNHPQSTKGTVMPKTTLPENATAEQIAQAQADLEAAQLLAAAAEKSETEIAKFLRAELKTTEKDLHTAEALVATLTAERDSQVAETASVQALATSYEGIVQASLNVMTVALGGSGSTTLVGADLITKHTEVKASYETKFKGGGVAATAPADQDAGKTVSKVSPLFAAMAQSVPNLN